MVLGAHQLSDGTLRAVALITLLLGPPDRLPPLILIDEPELGLHPAALSLVADLIKAASRERQVLVATQSAALLDEFDPGDVIVAERIEGESTFRRLRSDDLEEWLEVYSLSALWDKNVLGGRP
jgi:predicted ATPase